MPSQFSAQPLSRRQFIMAATVGGAALTVLPASVLHGAAQEETPASGFADLGLPTLDVTVTADGYEGIPDSLDAGRYLVTVTAAADAGEEDSGVAFIQPKGMSGQEFLDVVAQFAGPPDESGGGNAAASPIAGAQASPAAEEQGPPQFFYESKLAGGAFVSSGATAQVVLDLTPGEWVAWGDGPEAAQQPVAFEVTGEMPVDLVEPASGVTLTLGEYVIKATEGSLTAGTQVIRVDNVGAQPHFVIGFKGPEGLTEADVDALLQADMTGTPAAVDFDPETAFQPIFATAAQSTGTSTWITGDLPAGTYLLACFFPDLGDGQPHAAHGMYTIVEVGA